MTKKKIFTVLTAVIALAVGFLIFTHLTGVFRNKDNGAKYERLISASQGDFDVYFVGSSHLECIQPNYFWREYGITSYNLYNKGDGMDRYLSVLKIAFKYCKPSLVVLETDKWWNALEFCGNRGDYHSTFDNIPFSMDKVNAVSKLTDNNKERLELLFDYYLYHSRYDELSREDFTGYGDYTMGADIHFESEPQKRPELIPEGELPKDQKDERAFRELIEFCLSNGVQVILITLPYPNADEPDQRGYNRCREIAEEYGVLYHSFLGNDDMLDYSKDFRDAGHLNMSGAEKVSRVIGELIIKNFQGPDHRKAAQTALKWDDIYKEYEKALDKALSKYKDS